MFTFFFITFNNQQNGGSENNESSNNVSDLFKNFVVPSGLLYLPDKEGLNYDNNFLDDVREDETEDDDYISEDLHDRLINLASKSNQNLAKGGSKKKRKHGNKTTKKNRK